MHSTCPPRLMGKFQHIFLLQRGQQAEHPSTWSHARILLLHRSTLPATVRPLLMHNKMSRRGPQVPSRVRKRSSLRATTPRPGSAISDRERERMKSDDDVHEVSASSTDIRPSKCQRAGKGQTSSPTAVTSRTRQGWGSTLFGVDPKRLAE